MQSERKINADINQACDGWIQVTLSGDGASDLTEAQIEAALSAAEPVSRRNDEAGYVEFLNQDVPYIVRDIQGAVAILMDLETRNVIGYRVYDPDSVFAPQPTTDRYKPLQPENATKPVAWVYAADLEKGDGCFGNAKGEVCMSRDGKWINVDTPLYAAPPAPSVAVKELEWSPRNDQPQYEVCADTPFGRYKTSNKGEYGFGWMQPRQTVWSGFLPTLEEAKAAAQADYEARIRSALSAQVQDVAVLPAEYYSDDPAKLKQLLAQRDTWLVDNDHWLDFTRSLPAAPANQEGGHD